jgi:hypothetical protein
MENHMKKLLLAAAAVAMPVGIVVGSAGVSAAVAPPKTDVSLNTITCTSVTGLAKFAPALTMGGTSPENTNVKLALSGCTTDAPGVTITAGKGAGVLHSASNDAVALLGPVPVTGQVNIKWTSSTKLVSKMSTVTVTMVTGGIDGSYASLSINAGDASVSGDFAGTDNGASSTFHAESTDTIPTITAEAQSSKGLKKMALGTDGTHLTGNSLTLG